MPVVTNPLNKWPDLKVPYEITENMDTRLDASLNTVIAKAVKELNDAVGTEIFCVKRQGQVYNHWATFTWGSAGSSDIGYNEDKNPQQICLNVKEWKTEATKLNGTIHEMCHCLGFEHEEFATGFPLEAWGEALFGMKWQFGKQRMIQKQKLKTITVVPLDVCSIMMYSDIKARIPADFKRLHSSATVSTNGLTSSDVVAIKKLYAP